MPHSECGWSTIPLGDVVNLFLDNRTTAKAVYLQLVEKGHQRTVYERTIFAALRILHILTTHIKQMLFSHWNFFSEKCFHLLQTAFLEFSNVFNVSLFEIQTLKFPNWKRFFSVEKVEKIEFFLKNKFLSIDKKTLPFRLIWSSAELLERRRFFRFWINPSWYFHLIFLIIQFKANTDRHLRKWKCTSSELRENVN